MNISPEDLCQPISEEMPCGEDLEYDPAFQQIEVLKQEQGEGVVESDDDEPGTDWKAIAEQASDLMGRTRDLRVFVHAAGAALHVDGIPTFHQCLVALNNCMEIYWDDIHPQLDPDDNNDPMMRMNVLQNLNDYEDIRQGLHAAPLVEMKGLGAFNLRQILIAQGKESPGENEEVLELALIQGAFSEADPEFITALGDSIQGSVNELERLGNIWAERTDNYEAPSLSDTISELRGAADALSSIIPSLGTEALGGEDAGAEEGVVQSVPGQINSTADVITAIDRICDYYAAKEPSSPIPILLRRAQKMVSKSFLEILEDLAPSGVDEYKRVGGLNDQ